MNEIDKKKTKFIHTNQPLITSFYTKRYLFFAEFRFLKNQEIFEGGHNSTLFGNSFMSDFDNLGICLFLEFHSNCFLLIFYVANFHNVVSRKFLNRNSTGNTRKVVNTRFSREAFHEHIFE